MYYLFNLYTFLLHSIPMSMAKSGVYFQY